MRRAMKRVAASLGLLLAVLWLVAVFGALSGHCGPAPTDQNPAGTSSPAPAPAPPPAPSAGE